ncbi:unnamed protein product, partial [Ixodes persulcatus]
IAYSYNKTRTEKACCKFKVSTKVFLRIMAHLGGFCSISFFFCRTAWFGTAMISVYFIVNMALGLVMTYWYRDCDPELSGEISTHDQIIPFYVVHNLASFPGFSGIFLAGIVGATTSTTSSLINSLTAICSIDIASQVCKITDTSSKKVTKGIAFAIGILMTCYAIIIPYMGSTSRVLMILQGCITGPFVGLFLMALLFPCINTKAAAVSAVLTTVWQTWNTLAHMTYGMGPPRMMASLEMCPQYINKTSAFTSISLNEQGNTLITTIFSARQGQMNSFILSAYWSSLFSALMTVAVGLLLSWLTG